MAKHSALSHKAQTSQAIKQQHFMVSVSLFQHYFMSKFEDLRSILRTISSCLCLILHLIQFKLVLNIILSKAAESQVGGNLTL